MHPSSTTAAPEGLTRHGGGGCSGSASRFGFAPLQVRRRRPLRSAAPPLKDTSVLSLWGARRRGTGRGRGWGASRFRFLPRAPADHLATVHRDHISRHPSGIAGACWEEGEGHAGTGSVRLRRLDARERGARLVSTTEAGVLLASRETQSTSQLFEDSE